MIRVSLAAAACVAAMFLVGCNRGGIPGDQARLSVDGQVQVDSARRLLQLSSGTHMLTVGDRVRVLSGTAALKRADGGTIELRRGSEVRFAPNPALLAGSALAVSGDGPLVVEAAGTKLAVTRGAARVTRTLAVTAAAYTGTLTIDSYGRTLEVPALREGSVPAAGVVPAHARPIAYSAADEWDRRYLGVAIELADQLQARSDGLTSSLASGEGRSAGFYRTVLPALAGERQFVTGLVQPARQPGETLIGATLVEIGRQGTFAQRWTRAFGFRDEGASWGLVALDQGVNDVTRVTGDLDAAIGRAPLLLAAPAPARVGAGLAAPVAPVTKPAVTPSTSAPTRPSKTPRTPPVTTPGQPVTVPPPTTGTPLDPLLDPLTEILNKLLGAR
jgi:hypothetical protein